jgi:hypothetical protein
MRTKQLLATALCSLLLSSTQVVTLAAKDKGGDPPGNSGGVHPITKPSGGGKLHGAPLRRSRSFVSWEGTKVKPKDWPARAAQLRQIIAALRDGLPAVHRWHHRFPRRHPGAEQLHGTSGAGAAQVTVFRDGVAAAHKINISFFLPDPANHPAPSQGHPVVLNTSTSVSGFWNLAAEYGIATVGIRVTDIDSGDNETGSYKANGRAGVVNDIFNILAMMPDASRTAYSAGLVNGGGCLRTSTPPATRTLPA